MNDLFTSPSSSPPFAFVLVDSSTAEVDLEVMLDLTEIVVPAGGSERVNVRRVQKESGLGAALLKERVGSGPP